MFNLRFGKTERRLSREELLREIEAGRVPAEACVSSVEFFGAEGWHPLSETALWLAIARRFGDLVWTGQKGAGCVPGKPARCGATASI